MDIASTQKWSADFFVDQVHYKVWCKAWPSAFGQFAWGYTNMWTGRGAGGWSQSFLGGLEALQSAIREERGK
jgi:hypothetical protein